jgi:hypothetical protein
MILLKPSYVLSMPECQRSSQVGCIKGKTLQCPLRKSDVRSLLSKSALKGFLELGIFVRHTGALIEVWRLQRLEESANTCAAHVQTELEALLLPCENADSTSTSTGTSGALYSLAQEESSENAHATTTTTTTTTTAAAATATATATASNNFEEGRGAAGGENPTVGPKAAAVAAAEKLKARVMADAAVSDPSATLRIILAAVS